MMLSLESNRVARLDGLVGSIASDEHHLEWAEALATHASVWRKGQAFVTLIRYGKESLDRRQCEQYEALFILKWKDTPEELARRDGWRVAFTKGIVSPRERVPATNIRTLMREYVK